MPLYRDSGVVLRTHKLGEADRIITILTRSRGKVRAVAKGVRRTKSRFGARLEPGMHVDLQCYEGRSLDTITQAVGLDAWGHVLASSYADWTAAVAILETADRLTEEHESAVAQYHLLCGALRTLAGGAHEATLVLDAYLLRALSVAGWAPSLHDCARCGAEGPHRAFHIASGGAVCPSCRPAGSSAPAPATLELLGALLSGDWARADDSGPRERREGSGLTAAFAQWHLERGIRALGYVDRTPDPGRTR
ncbi:DNA repair protein RecO [Marihabitans asiaticum]|uniref:DNA repair protein RecO n=1 Tax=Marihabitans asiaticum TaxID=415218 RepID=A0A560WAC8_9MICO|nr:DNA repair protein RecO [Marihabitans asiaticum]TWD14578.1 DNA replication and repair protein RecO [Marihabitans asiaticum]